MIPAQTVRLTILLCCACAPPARAQFSSPPLAVDENSDPHVFETVMVVAEREIQLLDGRKTKVMTYNGSTPGPTIEVEVGDRLIVHVVNLLSEPTVIHWHGVEVPNRMDGSPISQAPLPPSGYFRYEFKVNTAATCFYHSHANTNQQVEKGLFGAIVVRDPRHDKNLKVPRAREHVVVVDDIKLDSENQVAPFSTDPRADFVPWKRAEDLANSRIGNHLLVNGRVLASDDIPTIEVESGLAYRFRFINVSNGRIFRIDLQSREDLAARPKTVDKVSVKVTTQKFTSKSKLYGIGSDQGFFNTPELVKPIDAIANPLGHHDEPMSNPDTRRGVTLTSGDRAEVVVVPDGEVGDEVFLVSHDFVKGKHVAFEDPQKSIQFGHDHFDGLDLPRKLIRFKIVDKSKTRWSPPDRLRWDPITKIDVDLTRPALHAFFGHGLPDPETGNVMFFMNVGKADELVKAVRGKKMVLPSDYDPRPFMRLIASDGYHVKIGETRYWEVINFTGNDHNFHTHGFRFQHIDTEYIDLDEPKNNRREPPLRLCFEDTIRVPKRPNSLTGLGRSYSIIRLAVRFDDSSNPVDRRRTPGEFLAGGLTPTASGSGGWLVHCHSLEHAARGMISFITVTR